MTAPKLSLLLAAALLCGGGKLDLSCPSFSSAPGAKAPLVGFEPLDPRHAGQAYVIRFGDGKRKDAQPRWTVQLGSAVRQVLFWAAAASVLL